MDLFTGVKCIECHVYTDGLSSDQTLLRAPALEKLPVEMFVEQTTGSPGSQ